MVVNISVKFLENISTSFQLLCRLNFMTKITINKVQRVITPKVGYPQLWFLCSASCLMVVNIFVVFRQKISNSFWPGLGLPNLRPQ